MAPPTVLAPNRLAACHLRSVPTLCRTHGGASVVIQSSWPGRREFVSVSSALASVHGPSRIMFARADKSVHVRTKVRRTNCRGILDHYREAKAAKEQAAAAAAAEAAATGQTWDTESKSTETAQEKECVTAIFTPQQFKKACEDAGSALVVVDFYKTACGACKYIQPGFKKLCEAAQSDNATVRFYKHNVFDEDQEELTELANMLKIKNVPMFQFYKDMELIDSFATRDRKRIAQAIDKYSDKQPNHVNDISNQPIM